MPDPIASTVASRFRRPAPEPEPPAIERPGRGCRLWSLLPVCPRVRAVRGGRVAGLSGRQSGPPVGEPPLIKAVPEPIKLPPDEAEETRSRRGGNGRAVCGAMPSRSTSPSVCCRRRKRLCRRPSRSRRPPRRRPSRPGTRLPPRTARSKPPARRRPTSEWRRCPPDRPTPRNRRLRHRRARNHWRKPKPRSIACSPRSRRCPEDTGAPAATAAAPAEDRASIEPTAERQEGAGVGVRSCRDCCRTGRPGGGAPAPAARAPAPLPQVRPRGDPRGAGIRA